MANTITIVDAIKSPRLFGCLPRFKSLETWTAWLVVLKAIFGLGMTVDDLVVFQRHTGRTSPPANGFKETYLIIGRRGGKSFISALVTCFIACFIDFTPFIKGGAGQISTAMRVLAETIASDVSLLVTFNQAIEGVIKNNPESQANPKALAQLDGYKRPLVTSLSGNLQRFGIERIAKVESLQEIIAEMTEKTETNDRRNADCAPSSLTARSDGSEFFWTR